MDERLKTATPCWCPVDLGRGTEGMILAVQYARTHQKPYLGICLGMQMAVIELRATSKASAMPIPRS